MSKMTSREQFDEFVRENLHPGASNAVIRLCWSAWQASRAAIEIDIPPGVDVGKVTGSDGRIMYWIEEGAVRNIIECEGLKVKK